MISMVQRMPRAALAALAVCTLGTGQAPANDYPKRPVTIIVPAGAGSSPDVIARIVAERLSQGWGQQAVITNRPGGGGMIATQAMAGAERDGHTLFMAIASIFTVMPELQPKLPIDLDRDLVPIAFIADQPMMIAVHPSLGIGSLAELIARGKSRPGDLVVGASRGTIPHMAWEMFRTRAGIDATFVPYPTIARAVQDVIGGTLNVITENPAGLAPALQSGALKPLAVAAPTRLSNYPDVPTVAEAVPALGGFEAGGWLALMAPAGTPATVVVRLSADLHAVLGQPEMKQRLEALGSYVRPLSPDATAAHIRAERDLWRPIVRQVGAAR
jgi:tripartite-type tricarboxylate transporter receptor subunit TctC